MIWGSEAPGLCEAQVKSEAHIRGEASQGKALLMHLTGLTAQIMKSLQTAKHAGDGRGEAQDPSPKALTPFLKELEYWSWKAFKMHFPGPTHIERGASPNSCRVLAFSWCSPLRRFARVY